MQRLPPPQWNHLSASRTHPPCEWGEGLSFEGRQDEQREAGTGLQMGRLGKHPCVTWSRTRLGIGSQSNGKAPTHSSEHSTNAPSCIKPDIARQCLAFAFGPPSPEVSPSVPAMTMQGWGCLAPQSGSTVKARPGPGPRHCPAQGRLPPCSPRS